MQRLSLKQADIRTIIWATGFTGDFSWIHLPAFGSDGAPLHRRGVSPVAGLYFVGFPWLSKRKSGIIYGVAEDARNTSSITFRSNCPESPVLHMGPGGPARPPLWQRPRRELVEEFIRRGCTARIVIRGSVLLDGGNGETVPTPH